MVDKNPEFSENLNYDNRNVVSGYGLRYTELTSVQGTISKFTNSNQPLTFELSPINWYANKTCLNMSITLPAATGDAALANGKANVYLNCLLKIPPINKIRISTRSSKVGIEITDLFKMACLKYYKGEDSKPGDVNSFRTLCDFTKKDAAKTFHRSWNLGEYIQAFFNTRTEIPLTEVTQIELTFVPKEVIAYSFTKNGADLATSQQYADSVYYNGYIKLATGYAPVAPVLTSAAVVDGEVISPVTGDILINSCTLSYEQERNPVVDLALKNMIYNASQLVIPYINCSVQPQTFPNLRKNYTMSVRLTNSVGSKLKRVAMTIGCANDLESLYKLGTYNSSHLGGAKLEKVSFDIGGRNISEFGILNYDYLNNKNFKYDFDNQFDGILENEGNLTNSIIVANAVTASDASLNLNPGRFRALPRNTFMVNQDFETVENDEFYSMNSGVPLNGDEVLNVKLTFDRVVDTGLSGVAITLFLYGIRQMVIMPNKMDFI